MTTEASLTPCMETVAGGLLRGAIEVLLNDKLVRMTRAEGEMWKLGNVVENAKFQMEEAEMMA